VNKILKKPGSGVFNMIGFYCWHQYDSNPALIELWIKARLEREKDKWQLVSKIRLSLVDTWQYFKIEDINIDKLK
jgi:hypothetical protein